MSGLSPLVAVWQRHLGTARGELIKLGLGWITIFEYTQDSVRVCINSFLHLCAVSFLPRYLIFGGNRHPGFSFFSFAVIK
jgi:hypothetical protein